MGICGTKPENLEDAKGSSGGGGAAKPKGGAASTSEVSISMKEEKKQSAEQQMMQMKKRKRVRHNAVTGESVNPGADKWEKVVIDKPEDQRALIKSSLDEHFMFSSLSRKEMDDVIDVMAESKVAEGDILIKQGDDGDKFYVLAEGDVDVIVNGNKVVSLPAGSNFGELALMYNQPRNATIKAATAGRVWTLDRVSFKRFLASSTADETAKILDFLKNIPLFKDKAHFSEADYKRSVTPLPCAADATRGRRRHRRGPAAG